MFRDVTQSKNVQEFAVDEVVTRPGQSEDVMTIDVPTDYIVHILFEYTIRDRRNRSARIGSHRVMANGHYPITDPTPSSHVTVDSSGEEPGNMDVLVRSDGDNVRFVVTDNLSYEEPTFITATARVLYVPAVPQPRIRFTISGLTGGQTWNGLGNGVHILEPAVYHRSPYDGSSTYTIDSTTYTFYTSTQHEMWRQGSPPISAYMGLLQFSARASTTAMSNRDFLWHNGSTVIIDTLSYTIGASGFNQDRVLSGSFTTGGVTFSWEREVTDNAGLWGLY